MRQTIISKPTPSDQPAPGTVLLGAFDTRVERRPDGAWYEPTGGTPRTWDWVCQYEPLTVVTEAASTEDVPGWLADLSETLGELSVAVQWLVSEQQKSGLAGGAKVDPDQPK